MWDVQHMKWASIRAIANTSLYIRRSSWFSPATQPDREKTHECRPNLYACRIFLPREHDGQQRLPLVIRVHGGGFVVNAPPADDPLARYLADNANCIVVSIDYGKAPHNKLSAAYEDVIALSLAVMEDPELPVDRSKVVLSGNSAGGNLVLATAQDPRLRSKVMGVAAIYPLVDLVPEGHAKMATRPDASVPDFLGSDTYSGLFPLIFDPVEKPSLTDPTVSPIYFKDRESLPPQVLMIGAQHDMFCYEDESMAEKLAAAGNGAKVETKAGWKAPGVQWHKIMGQPHAFEVFAAKEPEMEKARLAAVDELYSVISGWLEEVCNEGGRT
ncbi:uncharacterized protein LTR77_000950 [Saxophila tyrrhenica]|uniref:Alpha/beta hydrolase fold-3 domain-containing protein n=1 Tax=Saxophila tyrrhenica TaxID=1690608 RepID=A0AAV9PSR9_9PEZI|nr:hypothetical protein LTR77_000950 [Saxophila tyrrhenica]